MKLTTWGRKGIDDGMSGISSDSSIPLSLKSFAIFIRCCTRNLLSYKNQTTSNKNQQNIPLLYLTLKIQEIVSTSSMRRKILFRLLLILSWISCSCICTKSCTVSGPSMIQNELSNRNSELHYHFFHRSTKQKKLKENKKRADLGMFSPEEDSLEEEQEIWGREEADLDSERRVGPPCEEV